MNPLPPPVLAGLLAQLREWLVVSDALGTVVWANPSLLRPEVWPDAIGQPLLPRLQPPRAPSDDWPSRLDQALRDGHLDDTEAGLEVSRAGEPPRRLPVRARLARVGEHLVWSFVDGRAEQALRERAEQAEALLDTVQDFGRMGAWERDLATGAGRWDKRVFRYWGLDPAEGAPPFDRALERVHPEDRHLISIFAESVHAPGRYAQRYRVIGPAGDVRWIHSQWEIQPDADGRPARAVGVMIDDTEVVSMGRSLHDTAARLELAVELAHITVWRHDLATDRVYSNARGYNVLGLPHRPEGLSLAEIRARLHPDDVEAVTSSVREGLASNLPTDTEARYLHADGTWRHSLTRRVLQRDEQGRPVAFIGVSLDITERRLAELALTQASERIALATRGAGIGIWEHDLLSGEVRWDAQMYALRGLPVPSDPEAAAQAPRTLREALAHPDELPLLFEMHRRSLADGTVASYEFRVRWPDGSYRWLASRSFPVHDAQGRPVRQVGVNWDIHERVVAEAQRREALALQRQSEAKAQFMSRMSHELRTPLNAILGFTQLLEAEQGAAPADPSGTESRRVRLRRIREAAEQLLALVNELLDLSSVAAGEPKVRLEPVDLPALIARVAAELAPAARALGKRLDLQGEACTVEADPARLEQVLQKVLGHALRASGDSVRLRGRADAREALLEVTAEAPTVPQQLHLFDPLAELGDSTDGGMNLALVKALVACMNGRIEVDPQGDGASPGAGLRVALRLPLALPDDGVAPTLARASAPEPADAAPEATEGRVLYIEDNPVNVILVQELIAQRGGLQVAAEATGEAGIARARSWLPQLVLIDMQLPDIDGFAVLERLRADPLTARIPCIALSANALDEDVSRALALGFDAYWTKPIRFPEFLAGLERLFPQRAPATTPVAVGT